MKLTQKTKAEDNGRAGGGSGLLPRVSGAFSKGRKDMILCIPTDLCVCVCTNICAHHVKESDFEIGECGHHTQRICMEDRVTKSPGGGGTEPL